MGIARCALQSRAIYPLSLYLWDCKISRSGADCFQESVPSSRIVDALKPFVRRAFFVLRCSVTSVRQAQQTGEASGRAASSSGGAEFMLEDGTVVQPACQSSATTSASLTDVYSLCCNMMFCSRIHNTVVQPSCSLLHHHLCFLDHRPFLVLQHGVLLEDQLPWRPPKQQGAVFVRHLTEDTNAKKT